MTSTLKQPSNKKCLRIANKQNIRHPRKESICKKQHYDIERYFQDLEQYDIEQHAKDQLNYLSEIDANRPIEPVRFDDTNGTVSAWEDGQSNRQAINFKVNTRKNYRGFSFWSKKNSMASNYPQSRNEVYSNQENHEENVQLNTSHDISYPKEPQSIIVNDYQQPSHRKTPSVIVIDRLPETYPDILSTIVAKKCPSKESDKDSDKNYSQQHLSTITYQCQRPPQKQEKNLEIELLKMKILNNLHKETIINRSGNSFDFGYARPKTKRPRSSLNSLKKKPNNSIKLSNLIELSESNNNSIILKQHILSRKSKQMNAIIHEEPKKSVTSQNSLTIDQSPNTRLMSNLYDKYDSIIRKVQIVRERHH